MAIPKDVLKQTGYYATALKAPRIRDSAARLADQARDAGWTHEEYLSAVLSREVSSRESSGSELRIRAAGFPPARPSRTSTSTTSPAWPATPSPTWPRTVHIQLRELRGSSVGSGGVA